MLDGVMLLWFVLTAAGVLFVAVDIRTTPESPVLKWGFVLLCIYTGPIGAFLYVLGCREPLPGLHERYVAARWRQVLGSTMHCVAGDGVGILAGAVIATLLALPRAADIAPEYVLGFGFGWTIFQALFMRGMAGDSYRLALSSTFIPELLSMNLLMAGMVPVMVAAMTQIPQSHDPLAREFWFAMSMALPAGFSRRLSHELVAGGQPSQARDDDRSPPRERRPPNAGCAAGSGARCRRSGPSPASRREAVSCRHRWGRRALLRAARHRARARCLSRRGTLDRRVRAAHAPSGAYAPAP
jgi:hypothetical protein